MGGSRKTMAATDLYYYLPDECWEHVFRFLNDDEHHRYLEPLSLVSKQFLTITNRLRFSLTICDSTLPFLPRLINRFPTLTSLDLTRFHRGDLTSLLVEISRFPLRLSSLNLSNHPTIPTNGLRVLAKKMRTLTSLTCCHMGYLSNTDLLCIANCFPFLEELDLSYPQDISRVHDLSLALPKLRKVNLSGQFYLTDQMLFNLCKNCERLEEVKFHWEFITEAGIVSAIGERPSLRSLSVNNIWRERPNVSSQFISLLVSLKGLTCLDLSFLYISDELLFSIAEEALPLRKLVLQRCRNYTYAGIFSLLSKCQFVQHLDLQNAEFLNDQRVNKLSLLLGDLMSININGCRKLTDSSLFALIRNCPMLNEMKGKHIGKGNKWVEMKKGKHIGNKWVAEDFNSLMVNRHHQMKSLYLGDNSWLKDETIEMFAYICPNLQLLDLRNCYGISEGVVEVLRRCCKIRHLSLDFCSEVKLLGMDFEVPKLEVLNLSYSGIHDEALHVISKCCCGLLQLDLENCYLVTTEGVKEVVENCTQLREINLGNCRKVAANVVAWMVFSMPSLKKITAPPSFRPCNNQRELLLCHGCLVC